MSEEDRLNLQLLFLDILEDGRAFTPEIGQWVFEYADRKKTGTLYDLGFFERGKKLRKEQLHANTP